MGEPDKINTDVFGSASTSDCQHPPDIAKTKRIMGINDNFSFFDFCVHKVRFS
jgi:hypothetical protein